MSMTESRQRGFTLIEVIIFIVVVGAGLAGILSVTNTVVKSSADPMVRKQTVAIAESLLEEILLKEFQDPSGGTNGASTCTLATGSNRSLWDYNTYATTSGIADILGVSVSGLTSYNISPAVAVTTTTINSVSVKKVVVSVTGPQGAITLTGYRGNY
jgi:MSHA pilin protein MshD